MIKPLFHKCVRCEFWYPYGWETTLFLYRKQPLVNHVQTLCSKCHTFQKLWQLDDKFTGQLLDASAHQDGPIVKISTFASDRTWQNFCAATGRRYPGRPQFTAEEARSVENQVRFFHHLLETRPLP